MRIRKVEEGFAEPVNLHEHDWSVPEEGIVSAAKDVHFCTFHVELHHGWRRNEVLLESRINRRDWYANAWVVVARSHESAGITGVGQKTVQ